MFKNVTIECTVVWSFAERSRDVWQVGFEL